MLPVIAFLLAGIVVVITGTALARYADALAEHGGRRGWLGAVLLAAGTSLPELVTGVSAVRLGAPDIAAGELFGSNMANMLILATLDLLPLRERVLQRAAFAHVLSAAVAIALTAMAAVFALIRPAGSVLNVSPWSVLILVAYVGGTRAVSRHERRTAPSSEAAPPAAPSSGTTLRRALLGYVFAALVVLVSAPVFAWGAQGIAKLSGLGDTFVGTWLVGLATSLPEMVAALAAVRMGALDLAVGSVLGSNAFNMAIFFALDVAMPGSLFAALAPEHALSGLLAILIMALAVAAIVYRSERRFALDEPDSLLVVAAYALGMWLLYAHTSP